LTGIAARALEQTQPSARAVGPEDTSAPLRDAEVDNGGLEGAKARRQLNHDVKHELSTIMLLAAILTDADDIGEASRRRARQILGETRWLHQLLQAYDDDLALSDVGILTRSNPIRLDAVAHDVVPPIQLSALTRVSLHATEAWARIDKLAFWRVLRNVVINAVRAAGPEGAVAVRVDTYHSWAVVEVDDDGPGFESEKPPPTSLGLGIVQELMSAWGGELEICRGNLGGCRVRLALPLAQPMADVGEGGEA
jgi:signal transduction histidine kinase